MVAYFVKLMENDGVGPIATVEIDGIKNLFANYSPLLLV